MITKPIFTAALAVTLLGCGQHRPRSPIDAENPAGVNSQSVSALPPQGGAPATGSGAAVQASRRPHFIVDEPAFDSDEEVIAALAPAAERATECLPGSSGVIRIRIQRGATASILVTPGEVVDPSTRRCVLDALSTVDLDDLTSRANPSSRSSGYSAIVRLEW